MPAEIFRDPWGIPHIRAQNERDLFFSQGYATAQDRLWQMDADRHRALGRWSEWMGSDGFEHDLLLRRANMAAAAKADINVSSQASRAMFDAYSDGINAFIEGSSTLPVEYRLIGEEPEPWEPWHCMAVYKIRNTLLGTFEAKLLRSQLALLLGPEKTASLWESYPPGQLLTVPPGEEYRGELLNGLEALRVGANHANWFREDDLGSNAWTVSGRHTRSGKPLLAGDSHRALDTPNVYYQTHLQAPDIHAIGHSIPGVPGVLHFCHNERVAWGMTYGCADTQDLFIERFRQTVQGWEYAFQEDWRAAQVREERIRVRGEAEARSVKIFNTHHGPIVAGEPKSGYALALRDPGLIAASNWADAGLAAMKAGNWDEFRVAMSPWTDRVNNYAVADVEGNYGYMLAGKIPLRNHTNAWSAVPGWTGKHEWEGYIPHEALPSTKNPESGFAVTCNQGLVGPDYPYLIGLHFAPDFRARRIISHIRRHEPGMMDWHSMAAGHADRVSLPALAFTERCSSYRMADLSPLEERCLAILRNWNGEMDRDQVGPSVYAAIRRHLLLEFACEQMGDSADLTAEDSMGTASLLRGLALQLHLQIEQDDSRLLAEGKTWAEYFRSALSKAASELTERLGRDPELWTWGRLHTTAHQHPLAQMFPEIARHLNPAPRAACGDGDTPLAGGYSQVQPFSITSASVNRYIFDPADWSQSRWIVPLGSSGDPDSPHYSDQADLWANLEYIPQLWDWNEIEARAQSREVVEAC